MTCRCSCRLVAPGAVQGGRPLLPSSALRRRAAQQRIRTTGAVNQLSPGDHLRADLTAPAHSWASSPFFMALTVGRRSVVCRSRAGSRRSPFRQRLHRPTAGQLPLSPAPSAGTVVLIIGKSPRIDVLRPAAEPWLTPTPRRSSLAIFMFTGSSVRRHVPARWSAASAPPGEFAKSQRRAGVVSPAREPSAQSQAFIVTTQSVTCHP